MCMTWSNRPCHVLRTGDAKFLYSFVGYLYLKPMWISGIIKKNVSGCIVWFILMWCAKHPLTSSVWRWFRLSYCIPFSALHSSARNHVTRFQCSSFFQKRLNNKFCFYSVPMFCIAGAEFGPTISPVHEKKTKNKSPHPTPHPKWKNRAHHGCMLSLPIGCMKI